MTQIADNDLKDAFYAYAEGATIPRRNLLKAIRYLNIAVSDEEFQGSKYFNNTDFPNFKRLVSELEALPRKSAGDLTASALSLFGSGDRIRIHELASALNRLDDVVLEAHEIDMWLKSCKVDADGTISVEDLKKIL